MLKTNPLLPLTGLPATPFPAGAQLDWFDMDSLANYNKSGGHEIFGEHHIKYRFNSLGYRCPEFDAAADVRILAVGCSYVMGIGLPQEVLFPERFAERLRTACNRNVIVWNLGFPGASNDYICRMLFLGVPCLDPHIVLVNFTHPERREYLSVQQRLASFNPGFRPSDPVGKEIFNHQLALSSPHDDEVNLFRNYKGIESLLSTRCWLFSAIVPRSIEKLSGHIRRENYVGEFCVIDKARDNAHPGPKSHQYLADAYWKSFLALKSSQDLAACKLNINNSC